MALTAHVYLFLYLRWHLVGFYWKDSWSFHMTITFSKFSFCQFVSGFPIGFFLLSCVSHFVICNVVHVRNVPGMILWDLICNVWSFLSSNACIKSSILSKLFGQLISSLYFCCRHNVSVDPFFSLLQM